jgi:hypothetical protein
VLRHGDDYMPDLDGARGGLTDAYHGHLTIPRAFLVEDRSAMVAPCDPSRSSCDAARAGVPASGAAGAAVGARDDARRLTGP